MAKPPHNSGFAAFKRETFFVKLRQEGYALSYPDVKWLKDSVGVSRPEASEEK